MSKCACVELKIKGLIHFKLVFWVMIFDSPKVLVSSRFKKQKNYIVYMKCPDIGLAPITHLRTCIIKIATFKGGHPMCKIYFPCHKEHLLMERIRSLWEQILSIKRSSHFEKRCKWRESLLDPVVSLWCAKLFQRQCFSKLVIFIAKIVCVTI